MSSLEPFRFLHAGDLHLDSPVEGLSSEAPPEVLALRRDGLARLADAGIPSYVVHGNHDPLDGRSWAPSLAFPAAVHRFGTDGGESVAVLRDGREIARIHGERTVALAS